MRASRVLKRGGNRANVNSLEVRKLEFELAPKASNVKRVIGVDREARFHAMVTEMAHRSEDREQAPERDVSWRGNEPSG